MYYIYSKRSRCIPRHGYVHRDCREGVSEKTIENRESTD